MKWILPEALWDFMKEMMKIEHPPFEIRLIRWTFSLLLSSLFVSGTIAAIVWLWRYVTGA